MSMLIRRARSYRVLKTGATQPAVIWSCSRYGNMGCATHLGVYVVVQAFIFCVPGSVRVCCCRNRNAPVHGNGTVRCRPFIQYTQDVYVCSFVVKNSIPREMAGCSSCYMASAWPTMIITQPDAPVPPNGVVLRLVTQQKQAWRIHQ